MCFICHHISAGCRVESGQQNPFLNVGVAQPVQLSNIIERVIIFDRISNSIGARYWSWASSRSTMVCMVTNFQCMQALSACTTQISRCAIILVVGDYASVAA